MGDQAHWEDVYSTREINGVSWFEASATTSLRLIAAAAVGADASIIDVGGGASPLAGELLAAGYRDLTVLDISEAALQRSAAQLGDRASAVEWIAADVCHFEPGRRFDLWHDRAVFHFMVSEADRAAYASSLRRGLKPGGEAILATFGPNGPTRCSGLPIHRYSLDELASELGPGFEPLASKLQIHTTPSGREQQFLWARFRHDA
jgi:SAM-dependent methyltransferase